MNDTKSHSREQWELLLWDQNFAVLHLLKPCEMLYDLPLIGCWLSSINDVITTNYRSESEQMMTLAELLLSTDQSADTQSNSSLWLKISFVLKCQPLWPQLISPSDEARDTKTHLQSSDQQSALIHLSFLLMWYFVTLKAQHQWTVILPLACNEALSRDDVAVGAFSTQDGIFAQISLLADGP